MYLLRKLSENECRIRTAQFTLAFQSGALDWIHYLADCGFEPQPA